MTKILDKLINALYNTPYFSKNMISKTMPSEYKNGKMLFDKHFEQSLIYQQSYKAASLRIDQEMKKYHSAWKISEILPYTEGVILGKQLLVSGICPNPKTCELLKETACRLIPYGCVSAKSFEYTPKKYYIIIDTGTGDFFGNMACLIMAIFDQEFGHPIYGCHDYKLDRQVLISYFWGLALVYYDFGFKTNNEVLVYPHFRYSELRELVEPCARVLSNIAQEFFIFHEFGHIVDNLSDDSSNTKEDEFSADFFAFTAIRETAFALYEPEVRKLTIIGCLFALAAIDFIEITFPGLEYIRDGQKKSFPYPPSSYPSAGSRLERLLKTFPSSVINDLNTHRFYNCMMDTFQNYSRIIKDGGRPSSEYWYFQELKLSWSKEKRMV